MEDKPVKQTNGGRRRSKAGSLVGEVNQPHIPINNIDIEQNNVAIKGEVVASERRTLRTGKILVTFDLWDHTDSITCKLFLEPEDDIPDISVGQWLEVKGNVQFQSFEQELALMVHQFNYAEPPPLLQDHAEKKRVELHLHTKMSGLDGVLDVEEAVRQASAWGHPAVAITDHGVVQAFPAAYFAGRKHGIKIIYGLEGYLLDQENDRPYHIVILAKTRPALKSL